MLEGRKLRLAAIVVATVSWMTGGLAAAAAQDLGWSRERIPATGVEITVPLDVFGPAETAPDERARVYVTPDNEATFLFGAFENGDRVTVAGHRARLMEERYAEGTLDYAPLRRNWFVVSGSLGDKTFYHRSTFTCGGRLINSWAMIYPASRGSFYDRLVEQVHKTFKPGRGGAGDCRVEPIAAPSP